MGHRCRINNSKKFLLFFGLSVIFFTILIDTLLLRELKKSYTDTKSIISGIAADGYFGDEILVWLKEAPEEDWLKAGEKNLRSYGYDSSTPTLWDQKYDSAKSRIITVSVFIDLFLLLIFQGLACFYKKQDLNRVNELENILRQMQDTTSEHFELNAEYMDSVLRDRILSLREQIQTDHSRMHQEKEGTKTLVTDISHQLKTPVAALRMNLELLSSEELTAEEQSEFLESCIYQLDGLENLTKALVNVSRMEKGMVQIQTRPLPVKDTILSAVNRLYEKASDRHISIEMSENSFSEDIPVLHDPKWTTEVLVNIIDNAIKYSHAGTHITISLLNLTNHLRIDIEDEGMGIPQSEYHKIFQRFYRGSNAAHIEGSGVGLYLAREIVERQNGILFVHSKNGSRTGSIFSVQLPKA